MSRVVAVLGATGAVGRQMVATLEKRDFPVRRLVLLASPRSAGKSLRFRGQEVQVLPVAQDSFQGVDIALFSAGGATSLQWAPVAARSGAVVIDNSSAWRMHAEVPLVVPEVNMQDASSRPLGIIANPNCSTIQMVVALKPLHDAAHIEHIVVSTYQSVSGKGHAAVEELWAQTRALASGKPIESKVMPGQIAMNLLCDWKAGAQEYSEEEWKMVHETRKILGDPSIGVSPTTVRVPVPCAHAESVFVRFKRPMKREEALSLLRKAPGVVLAEQTYAPGDHPQPAAAAGTDPVYVGRVREDLAVPGALNLWIVADNLLKGAALNAVQIAERL
ncbi:MAG: aspartate-semialdehyde dehydrogenase [Deltaproteobacteria bacterium]|nr:aspartate-semialdehyde dehydrogenase [Deltaproteobacteria bacterium]